MSIPGLPIISPAESAVVNGYTDAKLTPNQSQQLHDLINHFNQSPLIISTSTSSFRSLFSSSSNAAAVTTLSPPLSEVERCYWSREMFLRCLRATKFSYSLALKRAVKILLWRREFADGMGVDNLSSDRIEGEAVTGKEIPLGFDSAGRPVLYMFPTRQNTQTGPRQIEFVVWCLERAIDLTPAHADGTLTLCIDLTGTKPDGTPAPPSSAGQGIKVLEILQTYYCERLGRAICVNVPTLFWAFYKLVGPFIDPVTKDKIQFNVDASLFIPKEQLQKTAFGGELDFEYNHEIFFPALVKLCAERRAENMQRWRQYGQGQCGLSEAVIRGSIMPSNENFVGEESQVVAEEDVRGRGGGVEPVKEVENGVIEEDKELVNRLEKIEVQ